MGEPTLIVVATHALLVFFNILKNVLFSIDLQYNQFIWDKKILLQLFSKNFQNPFSRTYCNIYCTANI